MKCQIIIEDEVWVKVKGLTPEHIQYFYDKYGPFVDGHQFMMAFKLRRWDGRVRFFEKTGKTYFNLIYGIIPVIEQWGYQIQLTDKRTYYPSPKLISEDLFSEFGITLRPHQVLGVNNLLSAGGGFGVFATGCGKSLMTAAISKAYNDLEANVITIVPSVDLINQTFEWYKKLGLDVGRYGGSEKDIHRYNVVATWQSLQNNPHVLERFNVVVWDESHGAKASVAKELLTVHASHMHARYGVTGTMPKSGTDLLTLKAVIGEIVCEMPARWLMDNGFLTPVEIETFLVKEKTKGNFPDYAAEKTYLSKNQDRIDKIADLAIMKAEQFGNTLVLVNSVSFGKKLVAQIEGAVFLSGENKTDERKENYDLFETDDNVIVIATFGIASTGISIDRVHHLMMIDPAKSFTRVIQSIGRSLRQADDKAVAHVSDVYSSLKFSRAHFRERLKYYAEAEYPIVNKFEV